jgi:outer membrane protein insertion porin family
MLRSASVCALLSVAWLAPGSEAVAQQYQFNTVEINGNDRIGDSAILRRAGISRGTPVSGCSKALRLSHAATRL